MATLSSAVHDWAERKEGLMARHADAIKCFDVQDEIKVGLSLLAELKVARLDQFAAARVGNLPTQEARYDLLRLFQEWYIPVPYVLIDIWKCRANGHWVEGAKELEDELAWYRKNICDVDEMMRRAHMDDVTDDGRPFREVMGELRRPA